ncbi:MAG TPA: hypothetical protein VGH28_09925 [Polyangiaceae bacterium]
MAFACGGSGDATDAGSDVVYGKKSMDAGGGFDAAEAATKTPDKRLTLHGGSVLSGAHVRAIYVGQAGADGSQSFDAYLQWLVTSSDYWGALLSQYGVGYEIYDGATQIDAAAFFTPGMIVQGMVDWFVLDKRLRNVIHGTTSGDAGDDDADASDDAGDAAVLPPIPPADAYILFLPNGVEVNLGDGATCVDAGGYHSFDQIEPYAVIPDCGRYKLVVSHEMAEMSTDPVPGMGWYSDADESNAGGEIGDICNSLTTIDGEQVTQLWSNQDGDCEPP